MTPGPGAADRDPGPDMEERDRGPDTEERDRGPDMEERDPGPDMEERDPGLARERTALAWTRTAISVAALGGAMLKTNTPAGILVLAMSLPVWRLGRPLRHERPGPGNGRRLLLVTVTVTLVSCAALALTLRAGLPAGIAPDGHR